MNSGIIRGADICDGSGKEPFRADLKFENGVISLIGTVPNDKNLPEYRADGLLLVPGFIDIHAHSDLSLAAEPEAFGKISQGITTEISGNCGLSPFPVLTEEVRDHLNKIYQRYGIPVTWNDYDGYIAALEQKKPAVNFASFCGYNTLRANFTGYSNSPFPESQILNMRDLLKTILDQGAVGLSTGLLYVPGKFSSSEELKLAVSALKNTGKPISTHLRSEGDELIEAVCEAIEIANAADHRLQISHLKTALPRNHYKIGELLRTIRNAQTKGCRITADRYPYTFAQTSLSVILPPPWDAMTDAAIMEDLRNDPGKQKALKEKLCSNPPDWNRIILCSTAHAAGKFAGEPYLEVCRKSNLSPEQLCVELMVTDAPGTMAAFGGLSEENLQKILAEPYVCCGSDETARPEHFALGTSHPRGFGSFPRFFNQVSARSGIAEAVRRMTSLPAEICHLSDRGQLKTGYAADMVLLDTKRFCDHATFRDPHAKAEGICKVFVNGVLSFQNGKVIRRAGRGLRIRNNA